MTLVARILHSCYSQEELTTRKEERRTLCWFEYKWYTLL